MAINHCAPEECEWRRRLGDFQLCCVRDVEGSPCLFGERRVGVGARFVKNRTPSGNVSFICGLRNVHFRKTRHKREKQATFLSLRFFKMHPKGSRSSNRPLACNFGEIVLRPSLQRPGSKRPLLALPPQKSPPFPSRPKSADMASLAKANFMVETRNSN